MKHLFFKHVISMSDCRCMANIMQSQLREEWTCSITPVFLCHSQSDMDIIVLEDICCVSKDKVNCDREMHLFFKPVISMSDCRCMANIITTQIRGNLQQNNGIFMQSKQQLLFGQALEMVLNDCHYAILHR